MQLTDCGCNDPCTNCTQVAPTPCTRDKCRKSLDSTKIAQLVWVQGLDENLCERFQRLADAVGLRDCAGNRVALETPVVLCSDFKAQLCAALTSLADGGEAIPQSTQLIGSDCKLYTLPPGGTSPTTETPNTVTDTATINFVCTGTLCRDISGSVKISGDAENILEIHADGLFVQESGVPQTACQQLQTFSNGADVTAGTVLIGADCQKHVFPGIPSPGFTVSDTSSVNLTLTGTNLEADVKLDPASIGRITGSGLQITCADVLICAPPVTVLDTLSINLSLTGQQVSADAIISPDAFNALELHANGLFVNVCSALDDGNPPIPAVVGSTVLVGADCNRYTIPPAIPYTGGDTPSVQVTVTGSVITAAVHLQPSTLLKQGPSGLEVLCEDVQDCIFGITNNFWTYNDLGNSVTFNPSADAGNQITVGGDGRPFVPAANITVGDTDCINLTLVAGVITANPIISAQPNNGLLCLTDGLFSATTDVNVTGVNSNCIIMTVTEGPANTFEIQAFPIVAAVANNVLTCTPSGLFVPASGLAINDCSGNPLVDSDEVVTPSDLYTAATTDILSPRLLVAPEIDGNCAATAIAPFALCDTPDLMDVDGASPNSGFAVLAQGPLDTAPRWRILGGGHQAGGDVTAGAIDVNDSTRAGVRFVSTNGNMTINEPTSECSRTEIFIKNVSISSITITSTGATIDGQIVITLQGIIVAGYPFGGNGGETVQLVWNNGRAEWQVF